MAAQRGGFVRLGRSSGLRGHVAGKTRRYRCVWFWGRWLSLCADTRQLIDTVAVEHQIPTHAQCRRLKLMRVLAPDDVTRIHRLRLTVKGREVGGVEVHPATPMIEILWLRIRKIKARLAKDSVRG